MQRRYPKLGGQISICHFGSNRFHGMSASLVQTRARRRQCHHSMNQALQGVKIFTQEPMLGIFRLCAVLQHTQNRLIHVLAYYETSSLASERPLAVVFVKGCRCLALTTAPRALSSEPSFHSHKTAVYPRAYTETRGGSQSCKMAALARHLYLPIPAVLFLIAAGALANYFSPKISGLSGFNRGFPCLNSSI
jgi:hypothetical protein